MSIDTFMVVLCTALIVGFLTFFVGYDCGTRSEYKRMKYDCKYYVRQLRENVDYLAKQRDTYKDIAVSLCDRVDDCMYCPYEPDKANERCVLWKTVKGEDV